MRVRTAPAQKTTKNIIKMKKFVSVLTLVASMLCANFAFAAPVQQNENDKVEGPGIKFEKTVHDYGTVAYGGDGNCEFVFTNNGTEPLLISDVRSSCGCTVPSWPREPIMPGKSSSIKVHYDTHRVGGISKSITVSTNGDPERVVLSIRGTVQPQE